MLGITLACAVRRLPVRIRQVKSGQVRIGWIWRTAMPLWMESSLTANGQYYRSAVGCQSHRHEGPLLGRSRRWHFDPSMSATLLRPDVNSDSQRGTAQEQPRAKRAQLFSVLQAVTADASRPAAAEGGCGTATFMSACAAPAPALQIAPCLLMPLLRIRPT